jgi:hypothetical protein
MHEGALPDHREQKGPACAAACVVEVFLSEDGELVDTLGNLELLPLDAGECLEGGAGCRPALRAVTVRCVKERICDLVANGPAPALAREHASALR